MKALIVKAPNQLEIIETPKPKIKPHEVLAKVSYCGICATDIAIATGISSFVENGWVQYPVRIGHEWSGIIEEVGSEVTDLKPGDHVVAEDAVPCLQCKTCLKGWYAFCPSGRAVGTVGNNWDGSFAEYIALPGQIVYKLRPETDLKEAALIEPASIAMHGIVKTGVKAGEEVVVVGTGAIGLTAVGLLKAIGATKIIMIGRRDSKLEYAKTMGADVLINSTKVDPKKIILDETEGLGADVVIETSGNLNVLKDSADFVHSGGRIGMLGFYEKKLNDFEIDKVVLNAIDLIGVSGMYNVVDSVIKLLESNKISFNPLITSVYPFKNVLEAVDEVIKNDGNRIKVLVEF